MLRKYILICLLAIFGALYLISCGDSSTKPVVERPALTEWEFTVAQGDSVEVAETGYFFKFDAVIWDSRCPSNQVCNWPGYADIAASWLSNAPDHPYPYMRLTLLGDLTPTSIEELKLPKGGYTFRLLNLDPYPVIPNIPQGGYHGFAAKIHVTKGEKVSTINGKVKIGGMPEPEFNLGDVGYFKHARLIGDTLQLSIVTSEHSNRFVFYAYMDPPTFGDTWPPSANIHFMKTIQSGVGDAFDTVIVRFDLSDLRELYRKTYGNSGSMILNLHTNLYKPSELFGQIVSGEEGVRSRLVYDLDGNEVNWPPEIIPMQPETLKVGFPNGIPVHYYDPNGTEVSVTVDGLPPSATISLDTYSPDQIMVYPSSQDVGIYHVRLIASDGTLTDTAFVEIVIVE